MANRPYLFATDENDKAEWDYDSARYYDSRSSIPLAWFYFFTAADVKNARRDLWRFDLAASLLVGRERRGNRHVCAARTASVGRRRWPR